MTPDPAPFLSTIVGASVALVAIIGGLLVARFVGLDSDQRVSRKVLADARERLDIANGRAGTAAEDLLEWDARAFFRSTPVLAAIDCGVSTPSDLIRLRDWRHSEGELEPFVAEVAEELSRARGILHGLVAAPDSEWDVFRRTAVGLPDIQWPGVWERVHDQIAMKVAEEEGARQRAAARSGSWSAALVPAPDAMRRSANMIRSIATKDSSNGETKARRRDELLARRDRTAQQVEDYEGELRRLEQAHAEIVRPDGRLWWGVGILVVFTAVGVALPLWVMSRGPKSLAVVQWAFWPFALALALLVGYIVLYLAQLTGRRK